MSRETAPTARARDVLRDTFGWEDFRPGQEAVVDVLLAGRSALAVFPTGGGKSLCYQLPALLLDGLTLVVSPLIALMKDQVDALRARGVAAARLDSSLEPGEARRVQDDVRAGRVRLLYVAPERLTNERFLQRLRGVRVSLLAVDEAHCISEWGHNFRPEYLKLARFATEQGVERVLALTATATPAVSADVREAFGIAANDHVQTGFHRPNLDLSVAPCRDGERWERVHDLVAEGTGPAIVYVTLQHQAEDLAAWLIERGVDAAAYHAGLADDARSAVQDAFMSGATRVVVATIAFGMGIDKADIRTIVHAHLPKSLESYAQEVGRAGRDGAPSRCALLACADDTTVLANFVYGDTPDPTALGGLVRELLPSGERFAVSRHDLSQRFDIRPLVVATAFTYLELEGILAATGPFYTTYKLQLARSVEAIASEFDADRAAFLRAVFARAKEGRTWRTLDLEAAADALGESRQRIAAAIGYLEERGDLTVKPTGLRHGYRRLRAPDDPAALVERLQRLFATREERDIERLERVLAYARDPGCLTRHLVGYFGEDLPGDGCGHCASCREPSDAPRTLPGGGGAPLGTAATAQARSVAGEAHPALATPRALARFLCALNSPAASRARLKQHPAFGALRAHPFRDVLALAEDVLADAPGGKTTGAVPPETDG